MSYLLFCILGINEAHLQLSILEVQEQFMLYLYIQYLFLCIVIISLKKKNKKRKKVFRYLLFGFMARCIIRTGVTSGEA